MQCSKAATAASWSHVESGFEQTYSCESSAETLALGRCFPTILNSLLTYNTKSKGGKHDP